MDGQSVTAARTVAGTIKLDFCGPNSTIIVIHLNDADAMRLCDQLRYHLEGFIRQDVAGENVVNIFGGH